MSFEEIQDNLTVSIPKFEECDKVTHYSITVTLGSISWSTSHRYSEFADLHDLLVGHHGIARDLLPPKKIIGNKDPVFVEQRRKDLELYLGTIVNFMSAALPEELANFLDIKYYETNFLLQDMAKYFYKEGDALLQQEGPSVFNPLQLMAISKQMQHPNPILSHGKENDFANIVDFCSTVKKILIEGSSTPYRSSNMIMNELSFNLNVFKNVEELSIYNAPVFNIEQLGPVRKKVKKLKANRCDLKKLCDILNCDSLHRELEYTGPENVWSSLENLDLSSNEIFSIDESVRLTPHLRFLNLSGNRLSSLGSHLTHLPQLVNLNLSNNSFVELDDLHTKFGNVKKLDLSRNNLSNLAGFSKLYSVVFLNLASNSLKEVCQIEDLCKLPCLEDLILTGNPIATIIDYRTKVLELFGKRACEICLDNERPTQKEMDKVAVLQALKSARQGHLPCLNLSHPMPSSSLPLLLEKPDVGTVARE